MICILIALQFRFVDLINVLYISFNYVILKLTSQLYINTLICFSVLASCVFSSTYRAF